MYVVNRTTKWDGAGINYYYLKALCSLKLQNPYIKPCILIIVNVFSYIHNIVTD